MLPSASRTARTILPWRLSAATASAGAWAAAALACRHADQLEVPRRVVTTAPVAASIP
jgi:hypothetical protein